MAAFCSSSFRKFSCWWVFFSLSTGDVFRERIHGKTKKKRLMKQKFDLCSRSPVWLHNWSTQEYCQLASETWQQAAGKPKQCCLVETNSHRNPEPATSDFYCHAHRYILYIRISVSAEPFSICSFRRGSHEPYCSETKKTITAMPRGRNRHHVSDSPAALKAASIYHVNCNWQSLSGRRRRRRPSWGLRALFVFSY